MAKIDDDGSGEISFQEFVQMMEWINDGKLSISRDAQQKQRFPGEARGGGGIIAVRIRGGLNI